MLSFNEKVQEDTGMRIIDLLPKKVKRMIYRNQHKDKYKAALLMMKALRKDPDVISRGLSKQRIQDIAADHFGLNHREFAKILDRKTRYEEKTPARPQDDDSGWVEEFTTEAYTIAYTGPTDIKHIDYSDEQLTDIDKLYTKVKSKHATPLIFDTNPANKTIKFHTTIFDPAIADQFKSINLLKGTGSVSNVKSIELEAFGIANTTDFLEFFQAVGLFMNKPLDENNFIDELSKQFIQGDFKIRDYIKKWEKFIKYCEVDKEMQADVIMLVNGSHFYRKEVSVTTPYVIWTGIGKYYDALQSKEGIASKIKRNTSDCVLIDGTPDKLYAALNSTQPIVTDDNTGMLSCDGVNWYQISLKKEEGGAKLGKLTKFMKGNYAPDQSNWELAKLDDIFKENMSEQEVETLIVEGFFGDLGKSMAKLGPEIFDKFKKAAAAVLQFGKKLFNKMTNLGKKYEKNAYNDIEKLTRRSKVLKESRSYQLTEKASQSDQLRALVEDRTINLKYKKIIEKELGNITTDENEFVQIVVQTNPGLAITHDSVNYLVSNVISFQILDEMIKDVKNNGIGIINDLNQSMSMGDTKLPVVKVYGNPGKADFKVITVGSISQTNPMLDDKQVVILKVMVKKFKDYFTCNAWIFAEMTADGLTKYHKIAFKKSGSSSFNYNIEGTNTVPEDSIKGF